MPIEHNWPIGHAVPHVLQLAGSFLVSTQADPQAVVPVPQLGALPPAPVVPMALEFVVEPLAQPTHASAVARSKVRMLALRARRARSARIDR
jgi:hypothetical protein